MNNIKSRRDFLKSTTMGISGGIIALNSIHYSHASPVNDRPNILWIVSEDNSPFLGCYGDRIALTPHLDKLASEGICYDNAFANAPVCAPMRNSIITGMYASELGCQNMRSKNPVPENIKFFPQYLRETGYYCTNNAKEDYNTIKPDGVWDESSGKAHYKNRKNGQPFFAIYNIGLSHEHKIHFNVLKEIEMLEHNPEDIELAPYHPDLPEIRHCYANYYDYVTEMDTKVGEILQELGSNGLADNTIVFYYSDHGGVLPRSKRFLFESGTRIPFIVKFPEKYQNLAPGKPGTRKGQLISLVDLAPTMLSLLNLNIPERFSGSAFLGKSRSAERDFVHFFRQRMDERYDMMRAVRDKNFRYIRNYMPHRKYGQHIWYLWRSSATRAWEHAYVEGKCNTIQSRFWDYKEPEELYDVKADPHNVHNLANDPAYKNVLEKMRNETSRWVRESRDAGFLQEGLMVEKAGEKTIYETVQSKDLPIEQIIDTAEIASWNEVKYLPELIRRLSDKEPAIRYWAATGCAILGKEAIDALPDLEPLLEDTIADVRITSAEALCRMGIKEKSLKLLVSELQNDNPHVQLHALNVLGALEDDTKAVLKDIMSMAQWKKTNSYFHRAYVQLIKKLKPGWEDYTIW